MELRRVNYFTMHLAEMQGVFVIPMRVVVKNMNKRYVTRRETGVFWLC